MKFEKLLGVGYLGYLECACGNLTKYIATTPQETPPGYRCAQCIAKVEAERRHDVIQRVCAVARSQYGGGKDVDLSCPLGKRDAKVAFLSDVEAEFKTSIAPETRGRLHILRQVVDHLLREVPDPHAAADAGGGPEDRREGRTSPSKHARTEKGPGSHSEQKVGALVGLLRAFLRAGMPGQVVRLFRELNFNKLAPEARAEVASALIEELLVTPGLFQKLMAEVQPHIDLADAKAIKNLEFLLAIIQHPDVQREAVRGCLENAKSEKKQVVKLARQLAVAAMCCVALVKVVAILGQAFGKDRRRALGRNWDDLNRILQTVTNLMLASLDSRTGSGYASRSSHLARS